MGGHCIPVYPRMYLWNDPEATVVRSAREANAAMPEYAVDLLAAAYGDLNGARVLVLGAAYRGGVKETAFSGVFPTVEALQAAGAVLFVSDPMYTADELDRARSRAAGGARPYRRVLQADHAEYRELAPPTCRASASWSTVAADRPGHLVGRPPRRHRRLTALPTTRDAVG